MQAVSDFYVPEKTQATHKIQSSGGPLNITLPQVPKLLKLLKSHWYVCGFGQACARFTPTDGCAALCLGRRTLSLCRSN